MGLDRVTAENIVDGSVGAAELDAATQDLLPNLLITFGAEAADVIAITIQARDAANNNLAANVLVNLWIATAAMGAPSATGNTYALTTGTSVFAFTGQTNAHYSVLSASSGAVVFNLTVAGAATRYVMAELDGRIYSSGVITWAA